MPTKRLRHTVTETPPVERVLRRLRRAQPDERIDFKELVILGAEVKLERVERGAGRDTDRRDNRVNSFLALRAGDCMDVAAGLALHESGWVRAE